MGNDDGPIDIREHNGYPHKFLNWFAVCLGCHQRWLASAPVGFNIFYLECPGCGDTNSFASPAPKDYNYEFEHKNSQN